LNKIVWVMGESAAGKSTFIRYAVTNPNSELMHQLRYIDMKIMPIQESMFLGEHQRIIIKDIVLDFLNKEIDAVILIKWQATDSLHQKYGDVLRKLKSATPDTPNEIILLSADSDVLYARLQKKSWWNDPADPHSYYSHEQMDQNVERLRSHVKELLELGFTLSAEIDTTDGYRIMGKSLSQ
jgi:hypothetical protein